MLFYSSYVDRVIPAKGATTCVRPPSGSDMFNLSSYTVVFAPPMHPSLPLSVSPLLLLVLTISKMRYVGSQLAMTSLANSMHEPSAMTSSAWIISAHTSFPPTHPCAQSKRDTNVKKSLDLPSLKCSYPPAPMWGGRTGPPDQKKSCMTPLSGGRHCAPP